MQRLCLYCHHRCASHLRVEILSLFFLVWGDLTAVMFAVPVQRVADPALRIDTRFFFFFFLVLSLTALLYAPLRVSCTDGVCER